MPLRRLRPNSGETLSREVGVWQFDVVMCAEQIAMGVLNRGLRPPIPDKGPEGG